MTQTQPLTEHQVEAEDKLSPMGKRLFRYIEFDEKEELIAEIRRHPIGIVFILVTGLFIATTVLVAAIVLATNLDNLGVNLGSTGSIKAIIIGIGAVVSLVALIGTAIPYTIYRSNVIYITNQKIAEVLYISLFNRKVTQLGMGQVEDVNIIQRGILPRIFNYGTLIVETAGEIENCTFSFVPNPYINSPKIIQAHEEYVEKYGN